MILKWEVQRIREESDQSGAGEGSSTPGSVTGSISGPSEGVKRSASVDSPQDPKRPRHTASTSATVRS